MVKVETGVIRESLASKSFTSTFVSGVGVAQGEGVATGDGFLITTPFFQTSFFPDLTHVNFLPAAVAVVPALEHLAPALGVAA